MIETVADRASMAELRKKKGFICDMDGVIYHGNKLLPGVKEFVDWLTRTRRRFLFLTNSPERTPLELRQKLGRLGLDVTEDHFYTSALATAKFLSSQSPGCTVYAIGEAGLTNALYEEGIAMNDMDPDYVVVGETTSYNYESILRAIRFVDKGAKLIGTNPDITGPVEDGIAPACGAMIAPIERATGKSAYFVGKPNALMMRTGLQILGVHSDEAVMVGDRMDTDVVAGIESGMATVLVMSGVSTRATLNEYAYRPTYVLKGVGDIPPAAASAEEASAAAGRKARVEDAPAKAEKEAVKAEKEATKAQRDAARAEKDAQKAEKDAARKAKA